jgi:hypothetical protein
MKKFIFLFAILFNQHIQINAQTNDSTSKSSFGINISMNVEYANIGVAFLLPSFVYNYKNQSFLIGPAYTSFNDNYNGYGFEFTYKIITNPGKIFNFFFFNHLCYSYLHNSFHQLDETAFYMDNGNYWDKNYLISNIIGYGLNIKLFKGFYINQSFGIIGISFLKNNNELTDYTIPSNSYSHIGSFYPSYSVLINLGIGYNLGSKK